MKKSIKFSSLKIFWKIFFKTSVTIFFQQETMKTHFCFILTNLFVIIVTSKKTTTIINTTKVSTTASTTLKTQVNSSASALCQAEITRKNLIAQLTTAGQKTINQLLVDVQFTTGVLIQHLISSIQTQFSSNISKIMNSSDSSRMSQLGQLLCFVLIWLR